MMFSPRSPRTFTFPPCADGKEDVSKIDATAATATAATAATATATLPSESLPTSSSSSSSSSEPTREEQACDHDDRKLVIKQRKPRETVLLTTVRPRHSPLSRYASSSSPSPSSSSSSRSSSPLSSSAPSLSSSPSTVLRRRFRAAVFPSTTPLRLPVFVPKLSTITEEQQQQQQQWPLHLLLRRNEQPLPSRKGRELQVLPTLVEDE